MEQTTQITTSRTSRGNKDRSGIRRRTGHYVRRRIGRCRARSTRGRTRRAGRAATDNGKTDRRQQDKKREHERQSRRTDTEKVNTHEEEATEIRTRRGSKAKPTEEAEHKKSGSEGKQEDSRGMADMETRRRMGQGRHKEEVANDRSMRGVM